LLFAVFVKLWRKSERTFLTFVNGSRLLMGLEYTLGHLVIHDLWLEVHRHIRLPIYVT
jgi:hypothetical protein